LEMLFRTTCLDSEAGFSCVLPFWKAKDFVETSLRTLQYKARTAGDVMGGPLVLIWPVDFKVFIREYARLIRSGMTHDQVLEILRERYSKNESQRASNMLC